MKSKKDPIYIFLHIQKSAGTTFGFHVRHNLRKEEYIPGYGNRFFYNIKTKKRDFCDGKNKFLNYINSLNQEQKDKIKIVFGHQVFFGIHKLFNRPAIYFTFLRDPTKRMVSMYNFRRGKLLKLSGRSLYKTRLDKFRLERLKNTFLANNKMPSLYEWCNHVFRTDNSGLTPGMSEFLKMRGFVDGEISKNSLRKALDKFDYVGITENFDEDSLYIYHELGINKFFPNQLASKKYYALRNYKKTKEKLSTLLKKDLFLYKCAILANRKFKKKNKNYGKIIEDMKEVKQKFNNSAYGKSSNFFFTYLSKLEKKNRFTLDLSDIAKEKLFRDFVPVL